MHALRLLIAAAKYEESIERRVRVKQSLEKIYKMSDAEFILQFRLNKATFHILCADLRQLTSLKESRQHPVEIKVLCTLSFLATGSYQRTIGVSRHILQRTVSRFISEVIEALVSPSFANTWIEFPATRQERNEVEQEFQTKYRLPGVVGCLDCTHIALVRPSNDDYAFYNRKGYYSMNVQMVCDANLRILNVNPRFGGEAEDWHVWLSSRMATCMEQLYRKQENVWLLGDSGYPQRPWLMTPILNTVPGSREDIYMQRHTQARKCIERCFGLLKSRWRCLLKHKPLHYAPIKAANIIVACSVLHNIAIAAGLPPMEDINEEEDILDPYEDYDDDDQNDVTQGIAVRNSLLARLEE